MPIHLSPGAAGRQYADEATPFDVTLTTADTAQDLIVPPSGKTIRRISIVNEGPGAAYIAFDATATTSDFELERRASYDDADITVATKISFIGESGKTPRVHGVVWSN